MFAASTCRFPTGEVLSRMPFLVSIFSTYHAPCRFATVATSPHTGFLNARNTLLDTLAFTVSPLGRRRVTPLFPEDAILAVVLSEIVYLDILYSFKPPGCVLRKIHAFIKDNYSGNTPFGKR